MGRPTRLEPIEVVERITVHGPHPAAVLRAAAIDTSYGRAMAGHNGAVRIGEHASSSRKYSGELGALQNFASGPFVGASRNRRRNPATILPGTKAPYPQGIPIPPPVFPGQVRQVSNP